MKKYQSPDIELILLKAENILAASTEIDDNPFEDEKHYPGGWI